MTASGLTLQALDAVRFRIGFVGVGARVVGRGVGGGPADDGVPRQLLLPLVKQIKHVVVAGPQLEYLLLRIRHLLRLFLGVGGFTCVLLMLLGALVVRQKRLRVLLLSLIERSGQELRARRQVADDTQDLLLLRVRTEAGRRCRVVLGSDPLDLQQVGRLDHFAMRVRLLQQLLQPARSQVALARGDARRMDVLCQDDPAAVVPRGLRVQLSYRNFGTWLAHRVFHSGGLAQQLPDLVPLVLQQADPVLDFVCELQLLRLVQGEPLHKLPSLLQAGVREQNSGLRLRSGLIFA